MMKTKQPACPECEKLSAVSQKSNELGDFIDWLQEKGIVLAEWNEWGSEELFTLGKPTETILAEYFGIDLEKVEQERGALLEWIQKENN